MKEHKVVAEGLLATILQHENEHLNGLTFVEKLTPIRRMALGFKLKKIASIAAQMPNEITISRCND
jgi:peptide deformylase